MFFSLKNIALSKKLMFYVSGTPFRDGTKDCLFSQKCNPCIVYSFHIPEIYYFNFENSLPILRLKNSNIVLC